MTCCVHDLQCSFLWDRGHRTYCCVQGQIFTVYVFVCDKGYGLVVDWLLVYVCVYYVTDSDYYHLSQCAATHQNFSDLVNILTSVFADYQKLCKQFIFRTV